MGEALMNALYAAVREPDPQRFESDFEGYLRQHGVEGDELAHTLEVGPARWMIYRNLTQNRIRMMTREFIPRTVARLGNRYAQDIVTYIAREAPRTPYLREVPFAFVEWALPHWRDDPNIPGYIPQLAMHEVLEARLVTNLAEPGEPSGLPLDLERPLRFNGTATIVTYDYAVHRLSKSDTDAPHREPTRVLVYRDEHGKARVMELTEFGYGLLTRLQGGAAVKDALAAVCDHVEGGLDPQQLSIAVHLFTDLGERSVLLGAEPK